jgi:hypothetical protein
MFFQHANLIGPGTAFLAVPAPPARELLAEAGFDFGKTGQCYLI